MDKSRIINYVAIYLRKSSGEETESDLSKHRDALIRTCKDRKWKYTVYEEIANCASIEMRPEMIRLLEDLRLRLYDALMVIDIDRLSRGSSTDFEYISNILINSDTLLCVDDRIMDLSNHTDVSWYALKSFFSTWEYQGIVNRLKRGKVGGARDGYWTNGTPPYPYEYIKEEKKLEINEEKLRVYREIIENIIQFKTPLSTIAVDFNKRGILGPRGGFWNGTTIGRIAIDLTHTGKIVINKTKGNGHKKKPKNAKKYEVIDESNWTINEGRHKAVKTKDEHEEILSIFKNKDIKKRSGAKKYFH